MSSAAKPGSEFSVQELKDKLRALDLSTTGLKNELIARLMNADPSGNWMRKSSEVRETPVADEAAETPNETAGLSIGERVTMPRQQDLWEQERDVMKRELAVLRQEIEIQKRLREMSVSMESTPQTSAEQRTTATPSPIPRQGANIHLVSDLLKTFAGELGEFDNWEMQLMHLRSVFCLDDGQVKILIGMKLKGKALEWLHSKPSHVVMPTEELLRQLRGMFQHHPNILHLRKQFEERIWRRNETFHEYVHQKVILGNRVPIDDRETVLHLIQGIPDPSLRDQARLHKFKTIEALLEAFEDIMLRPTFSRGHSDVRHGDRSHAEMHRQRRDEKRERPENTRIMRCYNCGMQDHYGVNCPVKHKGAKCFECREFGHIAAKCPKRKNSEQVSCNVVGYTDSKCVKDVKIGGKNVTALIDTGSDISLMCAGQYIALGSPKLMLREVKFRGLGSENNKTLGEFCVDIEVDGEYYPLMIHVVSDVLMRHPLLIGNNFLNKVKMIVDAGSVSIYKPTTPEEVNCNVPEIYKIDCISDNSHVDLSYIDNFKHRDEVRELIDNYKPLKTREVGVTMSLILKDNHPVYQRARRLSPIEKEKVNEHVNDLLRDGIIQPSLSEYASPVVLVKKKNDTTRLCVDYRLINNKIIKDRYPLPLIDDRLDALQGATVYSTLDLRNGFFHVPVEKESRKYTAFITPDGHYEFLYVPFGLCNSPAVFQKYINAVFRSLINEKIVLTYMDDLIIPTADFETGVKNLERVLRLAQQYGLKINWQKCSFLRTETEFLGYIIKNSSIRPSREKTEAVMKFPQPTTIRQVQQFLGLTGYFRKFIRNYSLIARPLSNLLKFGVKFQFDEKEKFAFEQLQRVMINQPILKLYKANAETELHTDASMYGYGAILLQRDSVDNKLHPVYYSSRKTTPAEMKYTSYELEVLAIVRAVEKFRVYLLGITFKIVTDCQAFSLTLRKRNLGVRVARWALALQEFKYVIEHRSGKNMLHVDALSRNPLPLSMLIDEDEESMNARIRKAQQEDDNLKGILSLAGQQRYEGYVVKYGLLFKEEGDDIRLVVPKSMQSEIVRRAHAQGHFSASKTEAMVKRDYWFSNMRAKVDRIVRNCLNCILAEKKRGKQDGFLNPIDKGDLPLETYHIDHLGPLTSTKKSYRHIFVVVDAFTKFVWLYATKSTSTAEVLDRLKKQAVIFGNPRRIISDRGTAFTSQEFEEYCKQENIEHVLITTGVPRANGQVERVNRTLIPILTKLAAPNSQEWHKFLIPSQQYLNATLNRSISTTPFNLLFGTHMRLKDRPEVRELIETEWTATFQEDRNALRAQAKHSIAKVQEENRKTYNKKRKEANRYVTDDLVAIKRTQMGPGLKLASKYLGPYQVITVLRNDRYIVRKVGEHEGPLQSSTSADHMKIWINNNSDESGDSDCDESEPDI